MKTLVNSVAVLVLIAAGAQVCFAETVSVTRLSYEEQESGVDPFATEMLVSDRYLRINDLADKDGYILYDDKEKTVYSISHADRSTLVMKNREYKNIDLDALVETSYSLLEDAPQISGHPVYRHRVNARGQNREVCMDIQLAQGLMPKITQLLHNYEKVVAANQVHNLDRTPKEYQTTCFIADQVYDTGEYYAKGLPILEWHSNNKKKALVNIETVDVDASVFTRPTNYLEFTLEDREQVLEN